MRMLPALVLALWLLALALNAPGQLSLDSVVQLLEGRTGAYAGAHPPLMSALLGLFDVVIPGTALYVLFASALFYLPLMALAAGGGRRGPAQWVCAVLLPCALATPLLLIYQGIVWKDVLFANLSVSCFSCLALADRTATRPRLRLGLMAAAALAAALAAATRQNGMVVPFCGALAVALPAWRKGRAPLRQAGAWSLLALGLYLAAQQVVMATAARPVGNGMAWGLQVLQRYDIAGMVAHGATLPSFADLSATEAARLQQGLQQHYSPSRVDTLSQWPEWRAFRSYLGSGGTARAWWDMLRTAPLAWLHHRAEAFRWMILPPDVRLCLPVHLGVEGPPEAVAALGLSAGVRPQDQALYGYARAWFDTPLFLNLSWIVAAAWLLLLLLHRRCGGAGDPALAGLLLAALIFAASFAAIGIACDVRYLFMVPAAVCAALAHGSRPLAEEATYARR